jgi:hypothetical protein
MQQLTKQYLLRIANPSTLTGCVFIDVPWNQTTLSAVMSFVAANAEPDIADKLHVIDYEKVNSFNEENDTFLLLIKLDLQDVFESDEIEDYQSKSSIV